MAHEDEFIAQPAQEQALELGALVRLDVEGRGPPLQGRTQAQAGAQFLIRLQVVVLDIDLAVVREDQQAGVLGQLPGHPLGQVIELPQLQAGQLRRGTVCMHQGIQLVPVGVDKAHVRLAAELQHLLHQSRIVGAGIVPEGRPGGIRPDAFGVELIDDIVDGQGLPDEARVFPVAVLAVLAEEDDLVILLLEILVPAQPAGLFRTLSGKEGRRGGGGGRRIDRLDLFQLVAAEKGAEVQPRVNDPGAHAVNQQHDDAAPVSALQPALNPRIRLVAG